MHDDEEAESCEEGVEETAEAACELDAGVGVSFSSVHLYSFGLLCLGYRSEGGGDGIDGLTVSVSRSR